MENIIYRCIHYKTDYTCKFFIILNDNNKIILYHNNHNHLEEDYNATMSLIKNEINKSNTDETSLVRTQMMKTMNKQYPSNIKTFDEIPDESKIFKTVRDEDFMIFKTTALKFMETEFHAFN
ncbi:hypothetical protein PIROE2DRAFT_9669 [Piromyces sp. E2]|nr:hypothetical protein PIROE2DRAFT_9669 [Piromyces sp. E2]|eukprot:OUM63731.1 hypothetical protein PIROE2DRAFT_9669 [Piromyces sp. E2]